MRNSSSWMAIHCSFVEGPAIHVPTYHCLDLNKHVTRNVARFWLGGANMQCLSQTYRAVSGRLLRHRTHRIKSLHACGGCYLLVRVLKTSCPSHGESSCTNPRAPESCLPGPAQPPVILRCPSPSARPPARARACTYPLLIAVCVHACSSNSALTQRRAQVCLDRLVGFASRAPPLSAPHAWSGEGDCGESPARGREERAVSRATTRRSPPLAPWGAWSFTRCTIRKCLL